MFIIAPTVITNNEGEITIVKYETIVKHVQSKKISKFFFFKNYKIIKYRFMDFSSKALIHILVRI